MSSSTRPQTQYDVRDPNSAITQPVMPGIPVEQQAHLALEVIKAALQPIVDLAVSEATLASGNNSTTYTHIQSIPEAVWVINHTFTGKFPSATVVDSAGTVVIGDVAYVGANQVVLTFNAAFSGKAFLN